MASNRFSNLLARGAALLIAFSFAVLARKSTAQPAVLERPQANQANEAEADSPGSTWLRIDEDKQGKPLALQTAIVRYVPEAEKARVTRGGTPSRYVDLVSAIHIGDKAYYDTLNSRFEKYEAVLYELVADKGTKVPKGRGTSNTNPLGALQNGMGSLLELEHQLEQIDYTKKNFIHADLSPEELWQTMRDRDESLLKMYMDMLKAAEAQRVKKQKAKAKKGEGDFTSKLLEIASNALPAGLQVSEAEVDIVKAFMSDDRARGLKVALAKQFLDVEAITAVLSGPDGSTLISGRNKRALDVLETQLAAGKEKLAIFYGAGHYPDMHERLEKRFKLVPVSVEWVDTWDLREK
ncbi:MAG: hypothetical protein RIB44_08975 [Lacipirellulaceae bacterium]